MFQTNSMLRNNALGSESLPHFLGHLNSIYNKAGLSFSKCLKIWGATQRLGNKDVPTGYRGST